MVLPRDRAKGPQPLRVLDVPAVCSMAQHPSLSQQSSSTCQGPGIMPTEMLIHMPLHASQMRHGSEKIFAHTRKQLRLPHLCIWAM